jgi:predicted nucleotidyltransferase
MINQVREILTNVCRSLNKHEVDYVIIGGIAVGVQGYPRYTADIDFWYRPTVSNYNKILNALAELGVDTSSLDGIIFDPQKAFLRIPNFGVGVEFLPQIPGIESFSDAQRNAIKVVFGEIEVKVLGYDDLIKNKESVGRPNDLLDVEELKKRREQ